MTRERLSVAGLVAMGVVVLSSGCAADKLEHPSYWWDAKVLAIATAASLAPDVDRSCVTPPAGAVPANARNTDERPVLIVRYRVAKSATTKAYLDTRGENWAVGDAAYVHPDTCRIKHSFSPAT